MANKLRCTNCKEYGDRETFFRVGSLEKVCSEACFRELQVKRSSSGKGIQRSLKKSPRLLVQRPSVPTRYTTNPRRGVIRDLEVHEEDGRQFVVSDDYRGGTRRVYGSTLECVECGEPFFRADRDANRGTHVSCSLTCSKRGDRAPSRNRPQSNPKGTLDRMFSKIVRWRDGWCVECGTSQNLECAHGFSRRYLAVRWDQRNAFALCRKCHLHYTGHPLEWDEWLKKRWGEDLYDEIRSLAMTGKNPDLDEMLVTIRAVYDPMAWERRGT